MINKPVMINANENGQPGGNPANRIYSNQQAKYNGAGIQRQDPETVL